MSLKEIFCQDKAISVLQRAYAAGRSAHAYIFTGPEGVGKEKTAIEYARLLLCKAAVVEDDFADSCRQCESCKLIDTGSHPDYSLIYKELLEFTREGKGKKTPVDLPINVVREFLIEKISQKPTLSKRKVFIVRETEKLNASSQNALLKSLEEPPAYCTIILLCTRPEKLLPTTKSRCQMIRFSTIDQERIVEQLRQMDTESTHARYFARLAQGSLGLACQWARFQSGDTDLFQTKKRVLDSIADFRLDEALELAEGFLQDSKNLSADWAKADVQTSKTDINRRAHKTIIRIIISAFYDAMKTAVDPNSELINFDQKERIEELAARFTAEQAAEKIALAAKTILWVDSSVNEKLIFEYLLLNLAVSGTMPVH